MTDEKLPDSALTIFHSASTERKQTDTILACNEKTAAYGLILTEKQAAALTAIRADTLKKTGRIEFGNGVMDKLILAFCDSPYISKETYEDTLHELIDLFYSFKNETADRVSDDTLIETMKQAFNGDCCGSLELLSGTALPAFVRELNESLTTDPFEQMESTDDGP